MSNVYQFIAIGLVTGLAAFVYSVVGFGSALLAVPLLLFLGLRLEQAMVISTVVIATQGISAIRHIRTDVDWRALRPLLLLAVAAMALGLLLLIALTDLPRDRVRQVVGAIVLSALLAQWLWKVRPRPTLHWGWGVAAFFTSGLTAGLCTMGGPPLVLWAMAHQWTNRRTRATLWASLLTYTPFSILLLALAFGPKQILSFAAVSLVFVPTTALGSFLGLRVGAKIPRPRLRSLAFAFLLLIAMSAIVGPLL